MPRVIERNQRITIAMLRVKNEARWLRRVLASLRGFCEETIVFDDHSEDDTPNIALAESAHVMLSPFSGLDESRDKNHLLESAMRLQPDWLLCIDGDEILEPRAAGDLQPLMMLPVGAISLRVLYLWGDERHVRMDGVYGHFRRLSLFRARPGLRFMDTSNGGHFHCGNIPTGCRPVIDSKAALLHLGYMQVEDRLRKYRWYNERDPNNDMEDRYRHMVQGDIPEVPAAARLRWAGPVRLETLCVR